MEQSKPNIFLSVGRPHTDKQEKLIQSIETFLKANGLNPQTVGRTYFANQQPLKSIEELLQQSSGIIVLALERTFVHSAVERQNSPQKKEILEVKLPSVWNQIEAAIAYAHGLPLMVLAEHGVKSEGLIEPGYDWYVKWFNVDEVLFDDMEFNGIFESWKKNVYAYQKSKEEGARSPVLSIGSAKHLTQLRQILSERFSEGELRILAFDLGLDYETLPGDNKNIKAMELVAAMNRLNRLEDLITEGQRHRRDVSWT
jgi:hypothetical protein